MDGDIAWAVEVQFYFGGASLSCGARKATGDHRQFYSRLHAKKMRICPLSCFFDLRSIYRATVTVSNT
jgi:hypothetical protein